jgi:hypothetical protein
LVNESNGDTASIETYRCAYSLRFPELQGKELFDGTVTFTGWKQHRGELESAPFGGPRDYTCWPVIDSAETADGEKLMTFEQM